MKGLLKSHFLIFIWCIGLTGCANFGQRFKAFLNGQEAEAPSKNVKPSTSFNNQSNLMRVPPRQYTRTTRKKLVNESMLNDRAGSLWVMEGQGSYLFAQNIMRLIGDSIGVRIDGEPKDQLQAKVNVIGDLYHRLESRRQAKRRLAMVPKASSEKGKKATSANSPSPETKEVESKEPEVSESSAINTPLTVKIVPSRIIERLHDGNYRIKGSQTFLIGPHQYRVIVTGIIRSEEFSEEGISATRLLDSRFDIVSVKKEDSQI